MCRSLRIEGRATPIMDTSSASRKRAPQSTRRVPQARLVSLSACIGLLVRDPFGYCSTAIVHRLFDARQTMVETFPSVLTVLEALADPVRLEIVRQVAGAEPGELMCGQMQLPVTKSTASHHLKTLLRSGITEEREAGTCKYIRLRRDELEQQFPGLLESVLRATSS